MSSDKRKNDDLMIGYLKEIMNDMGFLKTNGKNIDKRVEKIEHVIDNPGFKRGVLFLESHEGNLESLENILSKGYGESKSFSGLKILKHLLEVNGKKMEKNNSHKSFIKRIFSFK
jgi:hypothetical protein